MRMSSYCFVFPCWRMVLRSEGWGSRRQKKPGSAAVRSPVILDSVATNLVEKVQGISGIVHVVDTLPDSNQAEQCSGTRRAAIVVE